jgi:hypothetical protein
MRIQVQINDRLFPSDILKSYIADFPRYKDQTPELQFSHSPGFHFLLFDVAQWDFGYPQGQVNA